MSDLADVQEYTYEPFATHLTEAEALQRYRQAVISKTGDTLVVLQDHDCGHWTVTEYSTPEERDTYFKTRLDKYLGVFMRPLQRLGK